MSTRDLINGYAAYTSAQDLGLDAAGDALAVAAVSVSVTIDATFDVTC